MGRLRKAEFEEQFRFRHCRRDTLVKCASCAHVIGDTEKKYGTVSQCTNPLKVRRTRINDSEWEWNGARSMVCDAYKNEPLPMEVAEKISGKDVVLGLKEGRGVVLNSQSADCIHVDANCPYVVEEIRLASSGGKTERFGRIGGVRFVDISDVVPGEIRGDLCDMPCCEGVLRFQIWGPNGYRTHVGIHPNANDPKIFVRNAITKHERKSDMSYEEAEAFFDVSAVASDRAKDGLHCQISAVSDYIGKKVNRLGSKPLSEAVNPVWLWSGAFHLLAVPKWLDDLRKYSQLQDSTNTGADVWMYDERLVDAKRELEKPLAELGRIPEGIIPCRDTKGVFRNVKRAYHTLDENFNFYGILKPSEEGDVLHSKGATHVLEIRHVYYHAYEHYWGQSGIGFSGTASFHEE